MHLRDLIFSMLRAVEPQGGKGAKQLAVPDVKKKRERRTGVTRSILKVI